MPLYQNSILTKWCDSTCQANSARWHPKRPYWLFTETWVCSIAQHDAFDINQVWWLSNQVWSIGATSRSQATRHCLHSRLISWHHQKIELKKSWCHQLSRNWSNFDASGLNTKLWNQKLCNQKLQQTCHLIAFWSFLQRTKYRVVLFARSCNNSEHLLVIQVSSFGNKRVQGKLWVRWSPKNYSVEQKCLSARRRDNLVPTKSAPYFGYHELLHKSVNQLLIYWPKLE